MYREREGLSSLIVCEDGTEEKICGNWSPDEDWVCTRPHGHEGVHQAGTWIDPEEPPTYVAEWGEGDCYEYFDEPGARMWEEHVTLPEKQCGSRPNGHPWVCTREKGHPGLCMGGRSPWGESRPHVTMIAQWYMHDADPPMDDDEYEEYEPSEEEWARMREEEYLVELLNP